MKKFLKDLSGRAKDVVLSREMIAMEAINSHPLGAFAGLEVDSLFLGCCGSVKTVPNGLLQIGRVENNLWIPSDGGMLARFPLDGYDGYKERYYLLVFPYGGEEFQEWIIRDSKDGLTIVNYDDIPESKRAIIEKNLQSHLYEFVEKKGRQLAFLEV